MFKILMSTQRQEKPMSIEERILRLVNGQTHKESTGSRNNQMWKRS